MTTPYAILQTALDRIASIDALDADPSDVALFDADTKRLDELCAALVQAIGAVRELQRSRDDDRADLIYDLKEKAARESMTAEEWHGVGGQFKPK